MGHVPPPSSSGNVYQPGSGDSLQNQLNKLYQELHLEIGKSINGNLSPIELNKIRSLGEQLQTFLEKNKDQLETLAKNQGWSASGIGSFSSYFDATMHSLNNLLQGEPSDDDLKMIDEGADQMNYQISHRQG